MAQMTMMAKAIARVSALLVLFALLTGSARAAAPLMPPKTLLSTRSAAIVGAGALLAGIAYKFENPGTAAAALDRMPLEGGSDVGNIYGNGAILLGGAVALTGVGALAHESSLESAGLDLGRSVLTAGALVMPLKLVVNRTRPNGGRYSFPSGHAAMAFAAAPVLEAHFGAAVGVPAYILACAAAAGRLEDRKHYLSDVIFGGALGLAVGFSYANHVRAARAVHFLAGPGIAGISVGF